MNKCAICNQPIDSDDSSVVQLPKRLAAVVSQWRTWGIRHREIADDWKSKQAFAAYRIWAAKADAYEECAAILERELADSAPSATGASGGS